MSGQETKSGILDRLAFVLGVFWDAAEEFVEQMEPGLADEDKPAIIKRRAELLDRLDQVVADGAGPGDIAAEALPGDVAAVLTERARIEAAVSARSATLASLSQESAAIDALPDQIRAVQATVAGRRTVNDDLLRQAALTDPADSLPEQKQRLAAARKVVATAASSPLSDEGNTTLKQAVGGLAQVLAVVGQEIETRKQQIEATRKMLAERLAAVVPPGAAAAEIMPGATDADAAALLRERDRIAGIVGAADATAATLDTARKAIEALPQMVVQLRQMVEARVAERTKLREDAAALADPNGCSPAQAETLAKVRTVLDAALNAAISGPSNVEAAQALQTFRQLRQGIRTKVAELKKQIGTRRTATQKKLEGVLAPDAQAQEVIPGVPDSEFEPVEDERWRIDALVNDAGATLESSAAASTDIDGLRTRLSDLREAVETRRQERAGLAAEAKGIAIPASLLADQRKRVDDARRLMAEALRGELSDTGHQQAQQAVADLRAVVTSVGEELAALGGIQGTQQLCGAVGIDLAGLPAFEAKLGGRAKLTALLRVFPAAELGTLVKAAGSVEALAGVAAAYAPAELRTLAGDLGSVERLGVLMKTQDGTAIKVICASLGAPFAGALIGDGDSSGDVAALAKALPDPKTLAEFRAGIGPAGEPAALASLFKKGCGADPVKFVALCTTFAGAEAGAGLKAAGDAAGLTGTPDGLGGFLATGCDGEAAKLKTFSDGFAAPGDQAKLTALVGAGGVGRKPGVLANLYKTGCGGDPAKLAALRDAFGADLPKLKELLEAGGLATKPETLGDIVGTGLGGDVAKLKEVQAAFAGAGDPAKLGSMVKAWEGTGGAGAGKSMAMRICSTRVEDSLAA